MNELFKTIPKSLPLKKYDYYKKILDNFQCSMWEIIYRKDEFQATPLSIESN